MTNPAEVPDPQLDFSSLVAPSLGDFERMAEAAYARLPPAFRAMSQGIVIRIEDFPTDEVVEQMKVDSEFDLLGLFQGVGLAQGGALATTGSMPNMVFLYRRPILDYWVEHEIGHHFGLSDEDMEGIEAAAED
jgi:predicted Zn-dependent protease with MMP-like domain